MRNGILSYFGIATVLLILINVIVFFGVQMPDKVKIYDKNWTENCSNYAANAIYKGEYYMCPESAATNGGYFIEQCEKIPEDLCIYTYTDGFSLVGKNAFENPHTFITSMFMHGSLGHLLGNMIFLFILGGIVEGAIGMRKYLLMYFLAGIFGGIVMFFMTSVGFIDNNVPILGASGAIFGVLAAAAIFKPMYIIYIYFVPMPLIVIGLIYTGLQVYYILIGGEAGVANGAHLGGAIIGLIMGLYFRRTIRDTSIFE